MAWSGVWQQPVCRDFNFWHEPRNDIAVIRKSMIDNTFHITNRKRLIDSLNGGVCIVTAYTSLQRSNDAAFKFKQEANFWYLTGIEEPDWQLIIDGSADHVWLVQPDIDEIHRTFDGGLSASDASAVSGVKKILSADEGKDLIRQLAKLHTVVYSVGVPAHAEYFNFTLNPAPAKHWSMLERHFSAVQDCRKQLNKLRAYKQDVEIQMIRTAVDSTVRAFKSIHENFQRYQHEYQVEADFLHKIRFDGASGCSYDSIVASGLNACTLHYDKNTSPIRARQLVLMDMGAEYNQYAADISRTFAKGEPTKRQRQVHAAVETAHHRIVSLLGPMLSVEQYQSGVERIMSEALESIGLQNDEEGLKRYFPHAISHGLGIDVHDSLAAPKYFEQNMVLTVEPGIYIPEETIGVRIEDDILITDSGHRNLSGSLSTGL